MSNKKFIYVGDSEHFIFEYKFTGQIGWIMGDIEVTHITHQPPIKSIRDAIPYAKPIKLESFKGISLDGKNIHFPRNNLKRKYLRKGFYLMIEIDGKLKELRIHNVNNNRI